MSTDIVVRAEPAPLLPMEPEQAALMMDRYRQLCESILTPDDVIGIPGQPGGFVKRSGWSKLATFYGVSTTMISETIDRDKDGTVVRARYLVRATHPNGRVEDGDGACSSSEARFRTAGGRQKIEHDLPATAFTRARNRAISNLIGFGSVSAEETEGAEETPRPFGPPASRGEEDGVLRALEDLGADSKPASRVIEFAGGYFPKVAALAFMYTAASVRDIAQMRAEREAQRQAEPADVEAEASEEPEPEPVP